MGMAGFHPAILLGAGLILAAVFPARATIKGHKEPVRRLPARLETSAHQKLLSEMRQRRILDPEATRWSPEDMKLLRRLRWAEEWGALKLLEARFRDTTGLAVEHRPPGKRQGVMRLTRDGFQRYLRIKTRRALAYFEKKGVDAKWAFSMTDLKDRRLFDGEGKLTEWGDLLYTRAEIGKPVYWKTSSGEVMGNRPPKSEHRAPLALPGASSAAPN